MTKIPSIKKSFFLFLFCILIGSCTKKSNLPTDISIIPVADRVGKYEILNISDIANSITYIPLETNDDVLVHIIEQIVYENGQFILRVICLLNIILAHAPEKFEYLRNWPSGADRIVTDYRVFGLFDKRSGELKLMNQSIKKKLGFKNDIDNGPVIWPAYISTNDELVSFIHPEEFMEYYDNISNPSAELTKIAIKIEYEDNPIIIITKLK